MLSYDSLLSVVIYSKNRVRKANKLLFMAKTHYVYKKSKIMPEDPSLTLVQTLCTFVVKNLNHKGHKGITKYTE
jgi:hypothetical protein